MKATTNDHYNTITDALLAKGFTTATAYQALESAGFQVTIAGQLYTGIYASRVIAKMHERAEKPQGSKQPLEL